MPQHLNKKRASARQFCDVTSARSILDTSFVRRKHLRTASSLFQAQSHPSCWLTTRSRSFEASRAMKCQKVSVRTYACVASCYISFCCTVPAISPTLASETLIFARQANYNSFWVCTRCSWLEPRPATSHTSRSSGLLGWEKTCPRFCNAVPTSLQQ